MIYPRCWQRIPLEIIEELLFVFAFLLTPAIDLFVDQPYCALVILFKASHVAVNAKIVVKPD